MTGIKVKQYLTYLLVGLSLVVMAYQSRPLSSNLRNPSMGSSQTSSGQSPILVARINEKRAELENLKQLRDLSAELAAQMQTLEEKLSMLSDGAEGSLSHSNHDKIFS